MKPAKKSQGRKRSLPKNLSYDQQFDAELCDFQASSYEQGPNLKQPKETCQNFYSNNYGRIYRPNQKSTSRAKKQLATFQHKKIATLKSNASGSDTSQFYCNIENSQQQFQQTKSSSSNVQLINQKMKTETAETKQKVMETNPMKVNPIKKYSKYQNQKSTCKTKSPIQGQQKKLLEQVSEGSLIEKKHKQAKLNNKNQMDGTEDKLKNQAQKVKKIYELVRNGSKGKDIKHERLIYKAYGGPDPSVSPNRQTHGVRLSPSHTQQISSIVNNEQQFILKDGGNKKKHSKMGTLEEKLNGKMSIIWIFVVKKDIKPEYQKKIRQMYNGIADQDRIVPLVNLLSKAKEYLKLKSCCFKIVCDIELMSQKNQFEQCQANIRIIQFYIFHGEREVKQKKEALKYEKDQQKALNFKANSKKIKGIIKTWQKILDRAQDEVEEEISIYKINEGLEQFCTQKQKFPNFLKLTDTDKMEATLYRINLYGSIKLSQQEKAYFLKLFLEEVKQRYYPQQKENIKDYQKIDHSKAIKSLEAAEKIVNFYTKQSFYYQILNSMLRTIKTTKQFRPCILPFNETYHSIRLYYQEYLKEVEQTIPQMTVYRGCKLKKKDVQKLTKGAFIEMFGFMSTSKNEERAKSFMDRQGYMFVIHMKKRKIKKQFKQFDHGFVDINKYGLAFPQFQIEEQILFNALNVYQVEKIQYKDDCTQIHLEYGVIFDLLEKRSEKLTPDENNTLINYHFCTGLLENIEDQGDVFLLASQLNQAKQYYQRKIKKNPKQPHNYLKLSNVLKQCGEIEQAKKLSEKSRSMYNQRVDKNDKETCKKVFSIHSKHAQISFEKEDYLTADQDIEKAIQMLSDDEMFEKAVKLREKGQIKFKKGQVRQAEQDFNQSQRIFEQLKNQASIRRDQARKTYYLAHLSLFCSDKTHQNLNDDLQLQLQKIDQMQYKISKINQNIQNELSKINKSLKDVSLYAQDRQKYEICVKKARAYFYNLKSKETKDPQYKAKLLTMQAMVSDYGKLADSQRLMNEAIQLIQSKNPYDQKVAAYSKILAKMQKMQLDKQESPGKEVINQKPSQIVKYVEGQRKQLYDRCRQNLSKTLKVLQYHLPSESSPENSQARNTSTPQILEVKNMIGQLDLNESNYNDCLKTLQEIKESSNNKANHSEMAKSFLIMAKVYFARGQHKICLQNLQEADKILKQTMISQHIKEGDKDRQAKQKKYRSIYEKSDILLSIKFIKASVFNKQKKHYQALKDIIVIERTVLQKMSGYDSHPMLAQILQLRGSIQVLVGHIYEFDTFFQRSLRLRQKQFGYYHPANAKTYCIYAKYLVSVKDFKQADQMLTKGLEIMSSYDDSNPNFWSVYFSMGFFRQVKGDFEKAQEWYQKSLNWSMKYFDPSHITIKEIKLQYANSLSKSQKPENLNKSQKYYDELDKELQTGIRNSSAKLKIQFQEDDQKISLLKRINRLRSNTPQPVNIQNESELNITTVQPVDRVKFKKRLSQLEKTYKSKKEVSSEFQS